MSDLRPFASSAFNRRLFLGGAAAASATALVGCGSNHGSGSTTGKGGKTAIQQWYHQYGETGTQQAAKRYAAEYKDADVTVQWIPGDYDTKLTSGLAGSSGPDAFEYHLSRALVSSKEVVELTDLIADVKDDYSAADLGSCTVDGKIYAIPMIDDPQLIFYKKSLLDAKGIKSIETLDDLVSAAKELTTKDVKGLYAGLTANNDGGALVGPLIYSTGGRYLTPDRKVGFDTGLVADGLLKLRQLGTDKSLLLGAPTDWTDPGSIQNGLCAMQWCGMWAVPTMTQAINDLGVMPFPKAAPNGQPSVASGGWSAMVSAKSKHIDEAKAFTKWLWVDNTKDQEDWSLSYGFHIPPRKSLAAKASKLQSGVAATCVQLNSDHGVQNDPNWTPAMGTALTDAVTRILGKGADPEKELTAAVAKINSELAKG